MADEQKETPQKENQESADMATNKYVWIIGVIILIAVGWFGLKAIFAPSDYFQLILVDVPKEVETGQNIAFTWKISGGTASINHTAVHFGTISNAGELGTEVKPEDTKYTDFVKDFADGKYEIPLQFVGNTVINTPGKYYFRVHALIKDKHYWTSEYSIDVKPADYRVSLVNVPSQAESGKVTTFTWRVENGPTISINHTAIYYGQESNPGKLDKEVKPSDTKYPDFIKDFANGKFTVPLQFVGNAKIDSPGTYYFRVHAVINGQNYWSDEGTFEVK